MNCYEKSWSQEKLVGCRWEMLWLLQKRLCKTCTNQDTSPASARSCISSVLYSTVVIGISLIMVLESVWDFLCLWLLLSFLLFFFLFVLVCLFSEEINKGIIICWCVFWACSKFHWNEPNGTHWILSPASGSLSLRCIISVKAFLFDVILD